MTELSKLDAGVLLTQDDICQRLNLDVAGFRRLMTCLRSQEMVAYMAEPGRVYRVGDIRLALHIRDLELALDQLKKDSPEFAELERQLALANSDNAHWRAIVIERDTAYQRQLDKIRSLTADLDVSRKQRSWDAEQYGKTLGSLRDKLAAAEAECKELHVIVKDYEQRLDRMRAERDAIAGEYRQMHAISAVRKRDWRHCAAVVCDRRLLGIHSGSGNRREGADGSRCCFRKSGSVHPGCPGVTGESRLSMDTRTGDEFKSRLTREEWTHLVNLLWLPDTGCMEVEAKAAMEGFLRQLEKLPDRYCGTCLRIAPKLGIDLSQFNIKPPEGGVL